MLFALHEYDTAAQREAFRAIDALTRAKSPLLGSIESEQVDEVHPTRVSFEEQADLVLEPVAVGADLDIEITPICAGDLTPVLEALDAVAEQQVAALGKGLFEHLRDLTTATGKTVDARGGALTHELMLELLETVDMTFDEDGNPNLALLTGPGMRAKIEALPEMTTEQQEAFDALIARKRAAFEAGRRKRRLRPPQGG